MELDFYHQASYLISLGLSLIYKTEINIQLRKSTVMFEKEITKNTESKMKTTSALRESR